MATEYKFGGAKASNDKTERLILEGSSVDPKRYVDVGNTIELSDAEAESLRKRYKLTKVGEAEATPDVPTGTPAEEAAQKAGEGKGASAGDNPVGGSGRRNS